MSHVDTAEQWLETGLKAGVLEPLDVEVGRLLANLDPRADAALAMAGATASRAVTQGHACVPLDAFETILQPVVEGASSPLPIPDRAELHAALDASAQCAQGTDQLATRTPLWLDGEQRLYLGRHARYEARVAQALSARAQGAASTVSKADSALWRRLLAQHFSLDGDVDHQAMAVLTGVVSPLTVLTGGPGTGKTSTVATLLQVLLEAAEAREKSLPRVALAAPTGKAAARVNESLQAQVRKRALSAPVQACMPQTAYTLHRLLGVRRHSSTFHHDRHNPLPVDVVVVDEASMVDLPLMAKLLDAMPPDAHLVLLGDRDQLASVAAGQVLASICDAAGTDPVSVSRANLIEQVLGMRVASDKAAPAIAESVVGLVHSHRFGADSGLGRLAAAIRAGETGTVAAGLDAGTFAGVAIQGPAQPAHWIVAEHAPTFEAVATAASADEALAAAARLRVLTAVHEGPRGCIEINRALERALRQRAGVSQDTVWYPGRLLLITENDPDAGLYNGDLGIVRRDADAGLVAIFAGADGLQTQSLTALPACRPGFAMTIHKSQGSEVDHAIVVLPFANSRVLSRELLYTAVTRARHQVTLVGAAGVAADAVTRETRRFSGLAERLAGGVPGAG